MSNFKIILLFVLLITALVIIKSFNISYPVAVAISVKAPDLSVSGEGKVDAVPDTAFVETGISLSSASTVESAQNSITGANNKIISALEKIGIAKGDIKTSNYSVYPAYSYDQGQKINGYNANVTVSIKVKDLQILPRVITEVAGAGANQIQGVRFTIDNPDKLKELARNEAIKNAKDQAKRLSESLGIRLGKITNIVEQNNTVPYPMYETRALDIEKGSAPQIEPGTQTVTSSVTLYFEKL